MRGSTRRFSFWWRRRWRSLPYLPALIVWQFGTLALYAFALRAITRTIAPALTEDKLWWLAALAFPAVFVNLGHGQNGFLSAALLGGALALLDRRPVIAGILFGLLAYKPQLGILIPFVLIATGRWTAFAAAAATVTVLAAVVTAIFGWSIWPAFLDASGGARQALLEDGAVGWEKIQTVFAWVRMWGGPPALANAAQTIVTLAAIAGLAWLWRRPLPFAFKAAALAIAAVIAAPFSADYDMTLLAVAIAFLVAEGAVKGFAPWEKTVLAMLWLTPLVARSIAGATAIPLGALAMLAALAFIFRAAVHQRD